MGFNGALEFCARWSFFAAFGLWWKQPETETVCYTGMMSVLHTLRHLTTFLTYVDINSAHHVEISGLRRRAIGESGESASNSSDSAGCLSDTMLPCPPAKAGTEIPDCMHANASAQELHGLIAHFKPCCRTTV